MPGKQTWGVCAIASMALAAVVAPVAHAQVSFTKNTLQSVGELEYPTSLQFGPDDRLYVAQQDGKIRVYTIARTAPGQYTVLASETITLVHTLQNHNDNGAINTTVKRQCTGILVVGTPTNPVIYATSSDWRIAIGSDANLDTNSGIISRLTWDGTQWVKLDLVRGLPRCEENHAANGMALDEATNTLFVAQGGNTNMGAPSHNFGELPEYALSAAILSVDLSAIGEMTYDIPTLDDPSRSNSAPGIDQNDPFGGNDGANQAIIVPGGPVQVYAPGFRNPYDILLTDDGRMYSIDNGPNAGWGGPPVDCTNAVREDGSASNPDGLHLITGPGYYGGHPNPFRADVANTINGQSPITTGNAIECTYLQPGVSDGALVTWPYSVNGLTEYRASNFGGAMQGDLLAAAYNGNAIYRVTLNATGDAVTAATTLFPFVGTNPLDVIAMDDLATFPGTIWAVDHAQGKVFVFEPTDASFCTGVDLAGIDEDGDGYMNDDELDAGSDPCSPASVPSDNDGDFISDFNDPDDDNDGLLDFEDAFAIDATNGASTMLPIDYGWGIGEPGIGLAGLGFTGLMSDGVTDWADLFDPVRLTPGGAAGKFTIDDVTAGDAVGPPNTQDSAFQLGVPVSTTSGVLEISTRVDIPSFGSELAGDQRAVGLVIGDGTQSNFLHLAIVPDGSDLAFSLIDEQSDAPTGVFKIEDDDLDSALSVELTLLVDPVYCIVQARAAIDGAPPIYVGAPHTLAGPLRTLIQGPESLAVGVIATSHGGPTFNATWDYLRIIEQPAGARSEVRIDPPGTGINNSTYVGGSFFVNNLASSGRKLVRITIDTRTAIFEDLNFDIDGTGGDSVFKAFELTSNGGVGTPQPAYLQPHPIGGGFDVLEVNFTDFDPGDWMSFAIDVDPAHVIGTPSPGPHEVASVSGLELAGATWTAAFDDGSFIATRIFPRVTSDDGAANIAQALAKPEPQIEVLGQATSPFDTNVPDHTVRITGPAGETVRLVIIEGGRFVDGLVDPNAVGPYQANTALFVQEHTAVIEPGGTVDVPITFTRSAPEGGYNLIVAALSDGAAPSVSAMSNLIIARLGCVGDVNGDNVVSLDDLQLLLFGFGSTGPGDVNEDGFVDLADLQLMLAYFGASCD
ncbi:MAG: PQQ-dependent sugar dehydrogenase [Phycisphaerales bacterium]|nr:PQQ-dependent sugar dehydrogenase [Phycisphaerales bacterium]